VDAIVVSGMGGRPLMHFNKVGIDAYFAQPKSYQSVGDVISGFTNNQLPIMQVSQSCQGGEGSCHSH
jgi:predicted Fe-Mo cluster-binding NifX family protein